jgi:hypothetical protein
VLPRRACGKAPDRGDDPEAIGPQKSVMVNPRVLEYDTLISLANLKLHATATVTLSLKNIAMSYPAADYYGHPRHKQVHKNHFFDDMHSFIAAMASAIYASSRASRFPMAGRKNLSGLRAPAQGQPFPTCGVQRGRSMFLLGFWRL